MQLGPHLTKPKVERQKQIHYAFQLNDHIIEPVHEISNNVVCATSKASDQPAHTCNLIRAFASACAYAQSDQSLCLSIEYPMSVKLLTEHHLRFLSIKGD